jgi:circadian clock protein KaiB
MAAEHASPTRQDLFVLRLYVTGTTPRSTRAIANLRELCEQHLPDRYELQVIDVYQQPELAAREQLVAVPTLIGGCRCPCAGWSATSLIASGCWPGSTCP